MNNADNEKIPIVFISYSHDSPSHKKWVGEISSKLVENGIDVILDQWDLGLGDDLPKFMENSVTAADRVLMICSEKYVKKADEGKGGVGYEAMIVTGELIRDLGTSKFIPIVRQTLTQPILPKSVSTRFYVNFSENANFKEQFEILLRELHQMPAEKKPLLGKNPFALKPSGNETPPNISVTTELNDIAEEMENPQISYKKALDVARQGDLVIWRKMVRNAVKPIPQKLKEWRAKYEGGPPSDIEALQKIALEGADIFTIIFSIALAGVESGREKFINQVGLVDEILNPRNWNPAGLTRIVNFPDTIACIYQALHGAMCLQTNQISLSSRFARTKITKRFEDSSLPLYQRHEIIGWAEALGRKSTDTWKFLTALPEKWIWLKELYGSEAEFREALCAYYLVLNIIEFVDTIAEGNEEILQQQEVRLDVPLCFLHEDYETLQRAYRLVLVDDRQIKDLWKTRNISENKLKELWPKWIHHLTHWLSSVYNFGFRTTVIHKNLFDDIR